MKKLLVGVALLVACALAAVILVVGNVDKIIKGALEGIGSELLGTQVRVAAVELDLRSGSGQISGFTIANPAGFQTGDAFRMETIRLDLDLSSMDRQPLRIDDLSIQSPEIRLEAREDGSTNLQTLLDNIERNSSKADKKAAEEHPATADSAKADPLRISFETLSVAGVKVHATVPGQEPQTVVIPDIVMRDVGQETGLTPAEIGRVVIGEVINRSVEAVLKKKMTEKVEEAAKGFLEDLKEKVLPGGNKEGE